MLLTVARPGALATGAGAAAGPVLAFATGLRGQGLRVSPMVRRPRSRVRGTIVTAPGHSPARRER